MDVGSGRVCCECFFFQQRQKVPSVQTGYATYLDGSAGKMRAHARACRRARRHGLTLHVCGVGRQEGLRDDASCRGVCEHDRLVADPRGTRPGIVNTSSHESDAASAEVEYDRRCENECTLGKKDWLPLRVSQMCTYVDVELRGFGPDEPMTSAQNRRSKLMSTSHSAQLHSFIRAESNINRISLNAIHRPYTDHSV